MLHLLYSSTQALMKQSGGGNHLSVAWNYTGQAREIIPASSSRLSVPTHAPTLAPSPVPSTTSATGVPTTASPIACIPKDGSGCSPTVQCCPGEFASVHLYLSAEKRETTTLIIRLSLQRAKLKLYFG